MVEIAPMTQYFLDLPERSTPLRWDPHAGPRPERADTRYFGAVLREMESRLHDPDIVVHLTWDAERLPEYGNRVVAVVLGDEVGRIPRYVGRVRAVFKCYGTRPTLGTAPLREPSLTGLLDLAQYAVRWLRWLPGGVAHSRLLLGRRLRGRPTPPPVSVIPLGTFNLLDLPLIPIDDRPTDVFFAGSVEHRASVRHRLGSPKTRARTEMLAAVERLRRHRPDRHVDLRVTSGFTASEAASPMEYSRALMNSRICLAPRGTSRETFRIFEGLRCGCVVVGERLPRHWFYRGGPVVELDRWNDLDDAIGPLLDDPAEVRRQHARALAWWRDHCSEAAVGRFIAERVNGATGG
jgi:hypothetical protein